MLSYFKDHSRKLRGWWYITCIRSVWLNPFFFTQWRQTWWMLFWKQRFHINHANISLLFIKWDIDHSRPHPIITAFSLLPQPESKIKHHFIFTYTRLKIVVKMHFFFKNLYQVQGSNQPDKSHHIATHEYVTEKEQSIKKCEIYSFFF